MVRQAVRLRGSMSAAGIAKPLGTWLARGRYELLRPLARGGMADVFLARRRAAGIDKWLVVKRMQPGSAADPWSLDRFVREARLSMSLAHQNIVPVFDFGKIEDQPFLAMERVEGSDLGLSLARAAEHRLSPLLAAFIAAECCQALDYAHQRKGPDGAPLGIVHRDVTPRNVLLSWAGEVKLTDFGIAAITGDPTTKLIGTPLYMAPEQARCEPIDARADIYAVGLVLRQAVSGVCPRPGEDREARLAAARSAELVPWSLDEPIPPALVAIIDRATAPAPADRYADARAMLADLDGFIVAERAAHKAEPPARQLASWLATVWQGVLEGHEPETVAETVDLIDSLGVAACDAIGSAAVRSFTATAADEARSPLPLLPRLAGVPSLLETRALRIRARGLARRLRANPRRILRSPPTRTPAGLGAMVPSARARMRPVLQIAAALIAAFAGVGLVGALTASIAASLALAAGLGLATVALFRKRIV